MHINGYQLVTGEDNFQQFTLEINELLGEGWELHGLTQVVHQLTKNEYGHEIIETYCYQAMVLLKEIKPARS